MTVKLWLRRALILVLAAVTTGGIAPTVGVYADPAGTVIRGAARTQRPLRTAR